MKGLKGKISGTLSYTETKRPKEVLHGKQRVTDYNQSRLDRYFTSIENNYCVGHCACHSCREVPVPDWNGAISFRWQWYMDWIFLKAVLRQTPASLPSFRPQDNCVQLQTNRLSSPIKTLRGLSRALQKKIKYSKCFLRPSLIHHPSPNTLPWTFTALGFKRFTLGLQPYSTFSRYPYEPRAHFSAGLGTGLPHQNADCIWHVKKPFSILSSMIHDTQRAKTNGWINERYYVHTIE